MNIFKSCDLVDSNYVELNEINIKCSFRTKTQIFGYFAHTWREGLHLMLNLPKKVIKFYL